MSVHSRTEAILAELTLARVAKDVFLTEWYDDAADSMFDAEGREVLARVQEETRSERRRVLDVMRKWAAEAGRADDSHVLAAHMRLDFLEALVEVKKASAAVLQKAALVAPPSYRNALIELADEDTRHASELRRLVGRVEQPASP